MSFFKKKRFWTDVSVGAEDTGFAIRLDGRLVKTPDRADVILPTQAAAKLVAAEWEAVDGDLNPAQMPATQWANVAIDKIEDRFDDVVDMLAEYGGTDLLCYRATHPEELIARQASVWDAPLDWAREKYDAPLVVTQGVIAVEQPNQSLANLRVAVADLDPFALAALHDLVQISGSLVLALMISEKKIDAAAAWEAARVDEIWQNEQWGEDEEAAEAAAEKRAAFVFAQILLHSVRNPV